MKKINILTFHLSTGNMNYKPDKVQKAIQAMCNTVQQLSWQNLCLNLKDHTC